MCTGYWMTLDSRLQYTCGYWIGNYGPWECNQHCSGEILFWSTFDFPLCPGSFLLFIVCILYSFNWCWMLDLFWMGVCFIRPIPFPFSHGHWNALHCGSVNFQLSILLKVKNGGESKYREREQTATVLWWQMTNSLGVSPKLKLNHNHSTKNTTPKNNKGDNIKQNRLLLTVDNNMKVNTKSNTKYKVKWPPVHQ